MKTSRFATDEIRKILHQLESGTPILKLCCQHQISSATIYSWRRRARQWEEERLNSKAQDFYPPCDVRLVDDTHSKLTEVPQDVTPPPTPNTSPQTNL